jgi:hypothetical protein
LVLQCHREAQLLRTHWVPPEASPADGTAASAHPQERAIPWEWADPPELAIPESAAAEPALTPSDPEAGEPVHLLVHRETALIAKGAWLRRFGLGQRWSQSLPLPGAGVSRMLRLPAAVAGSAGRLLMSLAQDEEGPLAWLEPFKNDQPLLLHRFGQGLRNPTVGLTKRGLLVAVDGRQGRIYSLRGERPRKLADFESPADPPLCVLTEAAMEPDEFAVVGAQGSLSVYRWEG